MTAEPTPYERMGGAEGVRRLVDRFYDLMSQEEAARGILKMHPEDLAGSRDKLYEFLCGWLGGPPLYMEKRGHPRLRMRHMHFAIDDAAAKAWMHCMRQALDESPADGLLTEMLRSAFQRMADHLRNQAEHERPED